MHKTSQSRTVTVILYRGASAAQQRSHYASLHVPRVANPLLFEERRKKKQKTKKCNDTNKDGSIKVEHQEQPRLLTSNPKKRVSDSLIIRAFYHRRFSRMKYEFDEFDVSVSTASILLHDAHFWVNKTEHVSQQNSKANYITIH